MSRKCNAPLYGDGGKLAVCTQPYGVEHDHSECVVERSVDLGLARWDDEHICKRVDDLVVGDAVDPESCPFSAYHHLAPVVYLTVAGVEHLTPKMLRVEYDGIGDIPWVDYNPATRLRVRKPA